jgi:hypothetical protein
MSERKNYIFSTTRQWNPGDEFILFGLERLLREKGHSFNSIIYNRNPQVHGSFDFLNPLIKFNKNFRGRDLIRAFLRVDHLDNSFGPRNTLKHIDRIYIAGSPEWATRRLIPLYKYLSHNVPPVAFVGIGAWKEFRWENLSAKVQELLRNADLVTVRDYYTYSHLSPHLEARLMPCTALFSASNIRPFTHCDQIGLIYSSAIGPVGNVVSAGAENQINQFFSRLQDALPGKKFSIICHYIDELDRAQEQFPNLDIFYCYDAREYESLYRKFDVVVGGRVHGIAMAASLGIPAWGISHDVRGSTMKGFGCNVVQVNELDAAAMTDLVARMTSSDYLAEFSANILQHKARWFEEYQKIL